MTRIFVMTHMNPRLLSESHNSYLNMPPISETLLEGLDWLDRPSVAIPYGKMAVNLLQQVRGNVRGMENNLQKTFLISVPVVTANSQTS